jgi:HSP20 family protein
MAILRWNNLNDVAFLNDFNSLFPVRARSRNIGEPTAAFAPAVDVYEDEHKIVLKLEVPGQKQEDFDIQIEKNTLTVRGERKFEKEEKKENFHRIERSCGSFYRSFTVPTTVNSEAVKASYDAGVLRIELEKKAESKPKQIKVQVSSAAPVVENQPAA